MQPAPGDRRTTAEIFRERLRRVIDRSGRSQTTFARSIGLDRSTLAQLLAPDTDRLPRAETLAAIASQWRVSVDWLLGLSQTEPLGADVFGEVLRVEPSEPEPIDRRMYDWMVAAAGFKIRTVPSSVPDMLKTDAVLAFEYPEAEQLERLGIDARLAYMRRPETELEACCPVQTMAALARGQGRWEGLDRDARAAQLDHMADLCDELYPSLRLYLYDLTRTFSAPFTVFGQQRAVLFVGGLYLVFTATPHVSVLTRRFDQLVRAATVQPPEIPALLRGWRDRL